MALDTDDAAPRNLAFKGMPTLDPARHVRMRLVDRSHTLPVPGTHRFFDQGVEGEIIDRHDPFWAMLIADGSLEPVAAPPASED